MEKSPRRMKKSPEEWKKMEGNIGKKVSTCIMQRINILQVANTLWKAVNK
jgi:hypothetical protein